MITIEAIATPAASSSPTPVRLLFTLNEDLHLHTFLPFLSLRDICIYSCVSKACNSLCAEFCEGKIEREILPIQRKGKDWMESLVPTYFTYQQMLKAYLPFPFPIEANYRALSLGLHPVDVKGALVKLKLTFSSEDKYCGYSLCRFLMRTDHSRDLKQYEEFSIGFSRRSCSFVAHLIRTQEEYPLQINDTEIIIFPDDSHRSLRLELLEDLFYLNSLPPAEKYIQPLCGLFKGCYGSHGDEILFVTPEKDPITGQIIGLNGCKVTGDANVPAGKVSFQIDLRTRQDMPFADNRPLISFSTSPPRITTLNLLRNDIAFACKGIGCTNHNPPIWNPIWVNLQFLVYKRKIFDKPIAFSVVFEDPDSNFMHCIDFDSDGI